MNGFWGEKCTEECPQNCDATGCDRFDSTCKKCKAGWYVEDRKCLCKGHCKNQGCDLKSGKCLHCDKGWYGPECTNVCPVNCLDGLCMRQTGACVTCKDGFYGDACAMNCPQHCKDNKCNIQTGECLECITERSGKNCTCVGYCHEGNCSLDGRYVIFFEKTPCKFQECLVIFVYIIVNFTTIFLLSFQVL